MVHMETRREQFAAPRAGPLLPRGHQLLLRPCERPSHFLPRGCNQISGALAKSREMFTAQTPRVHAKPPRAAPAAATAATPAAPPVARLLYDAVTAEELQHMLASMKTAESKK